MSRLWKDIDLSLLQRCDLKSEINVRNHLLGLSLSLFGSVNAAGCGITERTNHMYLSSSNIDFPTLTRASPDRKLHGLSYVLQLTVFPCLPRLHGRDLRISSRCGCLRASHMSDCTLVCVVRNRAVHTSSCATNESARKPLYLIRDPGPKFSDQIDSVPWNPRYQPEEIINQQPPDEIVCVVFTPSTPQF